jgi:hypothetical protein
VLIFRASVIAVMTTEADKMQRWAAECVVLISRASVIAVMTTEADKIQQEGSTNSGIIYNGVTIRALLAIRQIQVYSGKRDSGNIRCENRRISYLG